MKTLRISITSQFCPVSFFLICAERMAEANRLVMEIGEELKAQLGLPDARVEICHTALAGQRSRNYALVVSFDELEKLSARLEKLAARLDRLTNKGDL